VKDKQKLTATVAVFVAGGGCSSSSSDFLPDAHCWPHSMQPLTATALLQTSEETVTSIFTMKWMKTVVVRKYWRKTMANQFTYISGLMGRDFQSRGKGW